MSFFAFSMLCTRGHPYKLTKYSRSTSCRSQFFSQRIVNVWNSLPNNTVYFTSLRSFKRSINNVNYSEFLKVFKPPPPVGAVGGYMFSGRPSVRASVRASVRQSVHDSRGSFMFPRYLQYLLTDFRQTFVIGA